MHQRIESYLCDNLGLVTGHSGFNDEKWEKLTQIMQKKKEKKNQDTNLWLEEMKFGETRLIC